MQYHVVDCAYIWVYICVKAPQNCRSLLQKSPIKEMVFCKRYL